MTAVPKATVATTLWAVDCSDYTESLTAPNVAQLYKRGFRRLISEINLPLPTGDLTLSQLEVAAAAGLDCQAYVYCDPAAAGPALELIGRVSGGKLGGVALSRLWLDLETEYAAGAVPSPGTIEAGINLLLETADKAMAVGNEPGPATGIYTDQSWFPEYAPGATQYASRPLWVAIPGRMPALPYTVAFGGWTTALGVQYAQNQSVAGIAPLDLSVFSA